MRDKRAAAFDLVDPEKMSVKILKAGDGGDQPSRRTFIKTLGATAAGLVAQLVVGLTGTLLVAIVVHIVHDVIAGAVIGRRARRRSPGGDPVAV